MAPEEQSDNSDIILQLKQKAIRELRETCLPINSLLWVFLERLAGRVVPWGPLSVLVSMGAVASTPFVLGVFIERVTNQRVSSDLASPLEGSVLMFMALLFVHLPHRLWLNYVDDVSELYIDEADARRAASVMLGSFSSRFQVSGTFALFLLMLISFMVVQTYLGRIGVTPLGDIHLLPVAFTISNGLYWEIVSVLSVIDVYACRRLNVYFFDPSSTIGIMKLSRQLSIHTLLSSIMIFGIFLVVYVFGPSSTRSVSQVWINWLMILVITLILLAFGYHQWLLYLIITREKDRFLSELAARISERLSDSSTAQLLEDIKLFTTIRDTRNTALRIGDTVSYTTAALIQVLPLLMTRLL